MADSIFDYQQWRKASAVTPEMLDSCLARIAELEAENKALAEAWQWNKHKWEQAEAALIYDNDGDKQQTWETHAHVLEAALAKLTESSRKWGTMMHELMDAKGQAEAEVAERTHSESALAARNVELKMALDEAEAALAERERMWADLRRYMEAIGRMRLPLEMMDRLDADLKASAGYVAGTKEKP